MKNLLLLILVFSSFSLRANQSQAIKLMEQAKILYSKGKFDTAAVLYEQTLKLGYEAAELYYNLGNAYFKSKKNALAIVNYEKAKLLAPNYDDIRYNLEIAKRNVVDKIDPMPQVFLDVWFTKLLNLGTFRLWGNISLILFLLFLISLSIYLYSASINIKKVSFLTAILIFVLSISTLTFSILQKNKLNQHNFGIVISSVINLKSSPDDAGTEIFVLHEGTKIEIVDEVGIWREIKLSNGQKGWLKRTDIEII